MSVPVNKRTQGELEVNVLARELCAYTLKITANEKHFPTDQKTFTEKIRDAAIDIYTMCWEANNIKVDNRMDRYLRRIELQELAVDKCNTLCRRLVAKSKRGDLPRAKVDEAYAAWRNHAEKGNTFQLLQRMDKYYNDLWRDVI